MSPPVAVIAARLVHSTSPVPATLPRPAAGALGDEPPTGLDDHPGALPRNS